MNLARETDEVHFGSIEKPKAPPKIIRYDAIDRAAKKVLKKFQDDPRLFGRAWVLCWEGPSPQAAIRVMAEMRAGVFASTPSDTHVWLLRIHAKRKVFVACVKPRTEDMTIEELRFLHAYAHSVGRPSAHMAALKEDLDNRLKETP